MKKKLLIIYALSYLAIIAAFNRASRGAGNTGDSQHPFGSVGAVN
jgi:hypothetical protein